MILLRNGSDLQGSYLWLSPRTLSDQTLPCSIQQKSQTLFQSNWYDLKLIFLFFNKKKFFFLYLISNTEIVLIKIIGVLWGDALELAWSYRQRSQFLEVLYLYQVNLKDRFWSFLWSRQNLSVFFAKVILSGVMIIFLVDKLYFFPYPRRPSSSIAQVV